jgi:DNA-binding transcriptional regulator YdaS (Cro superfamily)
MYVTCRQLGLSSVQRSSPSTTIIDVARVAGVSTATVSRVINGSCTVSPGTADAVKRALEACHYKPNWDAIRLRSLRKTSQPKQIESSQ